jgi:hypothetical protein
MLFRELVEGVEHLEFDRGFNPSMDLPAIRLKV